MRFILALAASGLLILPASAFAQTAAPPPPSAQAATPEQCGICDLFKSLSRPFPQPTAAPQAAAAATPSTSPSPPPVKEVRRGRVRVRARVRPTERRIVRRRAESAVRIYASRDVASLADLAGRPVSLGLKGSRTQKLAREELAKAGVEVKNTPLDLNDAYDALGIGAVKAIAVSGSREYELMDRVASRYGVHRVDGPVRTARTAYLARRARR